jgi:hypothetical protein
MKQLIAAVFGVLMLCNSVAAQPPTQPPIRVAIGLFTYTGNPTLAQPCPKATPQPPPSVQCAKDAAMAYMTGTWKPFWVENAYGARTVTVTPNVVVLDLPRPLGVGSCVDGNGSYLFNSFSDEFVDAVLAQAPGITTFVSSSPCLQEHAYRIGTVRGITIVTIAAQKWGQYTLWMQLLREGYPYTRKLHCQDVNGAAVPLSTNCHTVSMAGGGDDPYNNNGKHSIAPTKALKGLLGAAQKTTVLQSGTYTIGALETWSNGPLYLEVKVKAGEIFGQPLYQSYYVEYRGAATRTNIDKLLVGSLDAKGILIRQGFSLIDMTPLTAKGYDHALQVGQTLSFPLGGSLKLLSTVPGVSATVQVVLP